MSLRAAFTGVILLALASLPAYSQNNPEPKMVNFNLVAVDSHGQAVGDLKEDELQISDAGKSERVIFFRHNDGRPWEVPALASNEGSNRGAVMPYATVILFDMLNQNAGPRGSADANLERYLESLENADGLYLYLLTVEGNLVPVHGLPDDVDAVSPTAAPPWTRQIKPLMDSALKAVTRMRPLDSDTAARMQRTFDALNTLGQQLSGIPGRKNIAWIADGMPVVLDPDRAATGDYVVDTPQLRQLSETFDRSGITIYPVRQTAGGAVASNDVDDTASGDIGSIATLNDFAGMTGGPSSAGTDAGSAVKQAMQDVRASYQIGYYPAASNWDGKMHKLKVTCSRKGVRLQVKTGYYALAEPAGGIAAALDSLQSTGGEARAIGLRVNPLLDPNNPTARFELRIDARDIVLTAEAGQYGGHLQIAMIRSFSDGRKEEPAISPLDLHYSASERDQVLKSGINLSQDVALDEKITSVRFVVYDRVAEAAGSVTISIKSDASSRHD